MFWKQPQVMIPRHPTHRLAPAESSNDDEFIALLLLRPKKGLRASVCTHSRVHLYNN
jgi:hypothetical protein